jgi:hypothetical protein
MTLPPPESYGPVFADLLRDPPLQPLGPGQPTAALRAHRHRLTIPTAFAPAAVRDDQAAAACLAGVLLLHDDLDASHRFSQDLDTHEGAYWHGLMHRREPDFWNSKYWFNRVGRHPVFADLAAAAATLAQAEPAPAAAFLTRGGAWDAAAFVDLCQMAYEGKVPCEMLCRQIQRCEWELLFAHCYRLAVREA